MSPIIQTALYSTASLLHVKRSYVYHLLPHNILEPTVGAGLLHTALEASSLIRIPVQLYSYSYYDSNITIKNFTL